MRPGQSIHLFVGISNDVGTVHNRDGSIFALFDGSIFEQLRENGSGLLVGVGSSFRLFEAFLEFGDLLFAFHSHNFLEVFGFELLFHLSLVSLAFRPGFQHSSRLTIRRYS